MFGGTDITLQLKKVREKTRSAQEELVSEAHRILRNDLHSERKVLDHLDTYGKRFQVLDEEEVDSGSVFTFAEIRAIAIRQRLKLLNSSEYKPGLPDEALLRVRDLERTYRKELRGFRVLAFPRAFSDNGDDHVALLFAPTNHDNLYLVHRWGKKPHWTRQMIYWPLRSFENLVSTLILFTLALTLALPTWLITLDSSATYWSGYRAAAFMHLLIFNAGITAYITFAFSRNFSSSVWNRKRDFE